MSITPGEMFTWRVNLILTSRGRPRPCRRAIRGSGRVHDQPRLVLTIFDRERATLAAATTLLVDATPAADAASVAALEPSGVLESEAVTCVARTRASAPTTSATARRLVPGTAGDVTRMP